MPGTHRALFLDRDGTLTERYHYPSRPEHLRPYAGVGPRLAALQRAGLRLVVVTNQSGIARGYFTEDDLRVMHEHLARALARDGAHLDAVYHCPHHPDGVIPHLARRCDCRKPEPGMLLRAARELHLDLARSWFLGDILDDVEAGNRAGCRAVLVDLGSERPPQTALRRPAFVARDTRHALDIVAAVERGEPVPDGGYLPKSWRAAADADTRVALAGEGGRHG